MALSSVDEPGFGSRRDLAERSGNLLRTRTVDGIQRIEDRCSKIAVSRASLQRGMMHSSSAIGAMASMISADESSRTLAYR